MHTAIRIPIIYPEYELVIWVANKSIAFISIDLERCKIALKAIKVL